MNLGSVIHLTTTETVKESALKALVMALIEDLDGMAEAMGKDEFSYYRVYHSDAQVRFYAHILAKMIPGLAEATGQPRATWVPVPRPPLGRLRQPLFKPTWPVSVLHQGAGVLEISEDARGYNEELVIEQ